MWGFLRVRGSRQLQCGRNVSLLDLWSLWLLLQAQVPFCSWHHSSVLLLLLPGLPLVTACHGSSLGTPASPPVILEISLWCHFRVLGAARGPGSVFS